MIQKFLKYVEIRTKITTFFAFFLSMAILFYYQQAINVKLTAIFFTSMLLIDLTTTAINNYIDSKDYPEMLPFSRRASLNIIFVMFFTSVALGLYLAYCTDVVVLLLGILCFMCGVFYTYGPIPISRLPLGEIFSGVFQGAFVPFLLLYINFPEGTFLSLTLSLEEIHLSIQVLPMITLLLLCVIPTCVIANIMLANNTCDIEADARVNRFTLPYFIGRKHAVNLFAALYYICYLAPCIMVAFGLLHPAALVLLVTFPAVQKNINAFRKEQMKATTFGTAIQNFIILMSGYCAAIFLAGIFVRL